MNQEKLQRISEFVLAGRLDLAELEIFMVKYPGGHECGACDALIEQSGKRYCFDCERLDPYFRTRLSFQKQDLKAAERNRKNLKENIDSLVDSLRRFIEPGSGFGPEIGVDPNTTAPLTDETINRE